MNKIYKIIYTIGFFILSVLVSYKTLSTNKEYITSLIIAFVISVLMYIYMSILEKNVVLNKYKVLFIMVILFIPFQSIISFNFYEEKNIQENRNYAKLPDVFITHEVFPKKMDNYINDRIGLRDEYILLSQYGYTNKLNLLLANTIIGKDNWLYVNDKADGIIYIEKGKMNYDKSIIKIKEKIKNSIDICNKYNIKLFLFIPPNQSSIYPEYFPDYIIKKNGLNNYNYLKNLLREYSDILIMPGDEILEAKSKYDFPIYYQQDTHWNNVAAYEASKIIVKKIQKYYPNYKEYPENLLNINKENININEFYSLTGYGVSYNNLQPYYKKYIKAKLNYEPFILKYRVKTKLDMNENKYFKYYEGANKKGPKILVFHDSYMYSLYPFLEYGASKIAFYWTYSIDIAKYENIIKEYKPDVIIWEKLEYYMHINYLDIK